MIKSIYIESDAATRLPRHANAKGTRGERLFEVSPRAKEEKEKEVKEDKCERVKKGQGRVARFTKTVPRGGD